MPSSASNQINFNSNKAEVSLILSWSTNTSGHPAILDYHKTSSEHNLFFTEYHKYLRNTIKLSTINFKTIWSVLTILLTHQDNIKNRKLKLMCFKSEHFRPSFCLKCFEIVEHSKGMSMDVKGWFIEILMLFEGLSAKFQVVLANFLGYFMEFKRMFQWGLKGVSKSLKDVSGSFQGCQGSFKGASRVF